MCADANVSERRTIMATNYKRRIALLFKVVFVDHPPLNEDRGPQVRLNGSLCVCPPFAFV